MSFPAILQTNGNPPEANLLVVQAPLHRLIREFFRGVASLSAYVAMLAASVRLTGELISILRGRAMVPEVVCGISLGDFIAKWHRFHYNTADACAPAGAHWHGRGIPRFSLPVGGLRPTGPGQTRSR